MNSVSDAIVIHDIEGNIIDVNDKALQMYGVSKDEALKRSIADYSAKGNPVEKLPEIWREVASGAEVNFEWKALRPRDRSEFFVEIFLKRIKINNVYYILTTIRDINEAKLAKEALHTREEEYRLIVDTAYEGIWVVNAGNRTVFVNDRLAEILGYRKDEIVGKSAGSFIAKEDFPDHLHQMAKRERGEKGQYERRFLRKDGKAVWTIISGAPIIDSSGHYNGAIAMVTDITKRKKVEEALRDSERKYRAIFDQTYEFIGLMTLDGTLQEANASALKFSGISESDVIGKPFWETPWWSHSPELQERLRKGIERAAKGEFIRFEVTHVSSGGEVNYHDFSIKPITDESGHVIFLIPESRNITDRKKAEQSLQESESKFRTVSEASPVAVLIVQDSVYKYVNPAFSTITEYSREEALGMPFWKIIAPEMRDRATEDGREVLSGRQAMLHTEYKIITKTDTIRWVDYTVRRIDYDGMPAVMGNAVDVTERKTAEEALVEAKNEAEMYLDLMGHDINNLNQIGIGYLELVLENLNSDDQNVEYVNKSLQAIKDSSRLISNVKTLQRLKAGDTKTWPQDLGKTLVDTIASFRHVPGRNVTIDYGGAEGYTVMANELLKDVFSSLIGNAIKHSGGAVHIDISVKEIIDKGKSFFMVAIEDNGPGIPDILKKTIFTRFQRGQITATGRGIGLFWARTLVGSFRGRIYVEDRVQGDHTKGSRFVVVLPSAGKTEAE